MNKFYLTFGVKYGQEKHPIHSWVDPDGYVIIYAPNEAKARKMAFEIFDQYWAFLTEAHNFQREYYPLGRLKVFKYKEKQNEKPSKIVK